MIDRIAALCQQKNISITRLEREVNLGRSTIRYWDNHPPAVDKVAKVARYFGVSVDYLIGNTDDPYSHQSERSKIAEALKEVQADIGQKLATLNQQDLEENWNAPPGRLSQRSIPLNLFRGWLKAATPPRLSQAVPSPPYAA